jgi:hypothetical protein
LQKWVFSHSFLTIFCLVYSHEWILWIFWIDMNFCVFRC